MADLDMFSGSIYKSFEVVRVRPVPELTSTLVEVLHRPSGARIIHIQNDDPENLFSLSFQTVPNSSNGAAHVLEHLVLCGSEKYPVRDPFFSMNRRSLNTFMNAFTGSDFTCYPASSQIEKDFYNLLDVYIDSVFHPKLDPMSFLQEAHRLEFSDPEDPASELTRTGVVYSEMKGAYGQPIRRLANQMDRLLFPDSPYQHDSGGDPKEIPTLTLHELKDFHANFYHPSRCVFFFYGNFPLRGHLDALDSLILGNASKLPPLPAFPRQTRFLSPKGFSMTYPIEENASLEKKSYASFGYLTTDITNQLDCLGLTVLDIVLLGHDASPLKQALLDTGLCRQVASSLDTQSAEVPYVITAMGMNAEDAPALEKAILQTLQKIASEGIPKEKISQALHEVEFAKSEIGSDDAPFGLTLYFRAALLEHHNIDPMKGLEVQHLFDILHEAIRDNPRYFSQLIEKYLLHNPHRVLLTMSPSTTLEAKERAEERKEIEALLNCMSQVEKNDICTKAIKLCSLQEEEQNLECLPTVHISDVPTKTLHLDLHEERIGNFPCYYHTTFTNHITYLDVASPLPKIAREDLWLLHLLFYLMPQLGCGTKNYQETLEHIHAHTGGIFASFALYSQATNSNSITMAWQLQGKALDRNVENLCLIMTDMLTSMRLSETERIEQLITKLHTDLERSLPQRALDYALLESRQSLSEPLGLMNDLFGLPYVHNIRELVAQYKSREESFLKDLARLKELLAPTSGTELVVTTDTSVLNVLKRENFYGLCDLPNRLYHSFEPYAMKTGPKTSRGYIIASNVSYTALSLRTVPYAHNDSAAIAILSQLMNDSFLHKRLREQGGAYGGGAKASSSKGTFSFYSYKDPNLFATLEAYEASTQYIKEGLFSNRQLDEAKLGIFQDLDTPVSPGNKAQTAYVWMKQGKLKELRQHWRDQVFAADSEKIRSLIDPYFSGIWKNNPFIAFAGKELMEKERATFIQKGNDLTLLQT